MTNHPITFEVAQRIWGDPNVNLIDDKTRAAFFAVWVMLICEFDEALAEEKAKNSE